MTRIAIMTDETGWHTRQLQAALRTRGAVGRCVDLAEQVPEQDPLWASLAIEVVDLPGFGQSVPVGERLQSRVEQADRLVAEVEQIGVEKGEVVVRLGCTGHVRADAAAVALGVIFVFDAHLGGKCRDREMGNVTGCEHVLTTVDTAEGVDDDAVCHRQAGRSGELDIRLDPDSGDDRVRVDWTAVPEHDSCAGTVLFDLGG